MHAVHLQLPLTLCPLRGKHPWSRNDRRVRRSTQQAALDRPNISPGVDSLAQQPTMKMAGTLKKAEPIQESKIEKVC